MILFSSNRKGQRRHESCQLSQRLHGQSGQNAHPNVLVVVIEQEAMAIRRKEKSVTIVLSGQAGLIAQ